MGAWLEMEPVTDEVSLMLYFWALGGVLHLRVDSTSEKCGRSQTAVQMWLKTKNCVPVRPVGSMESVCQ